jgi:WD40 repeat protein
VIGDASQGVIEYYDNNTFTKISPNFHTNTIWHLKYLPFKNGYVASTSGDKAVDVWDTLTWTSVQRYTSHTNAVYSLGQIDNDTIVSGSHDTTIQIWRISTGETLKIINVNAVVIVVRVFSIEYKQIVCGTFGGSNNLQIYNYDTGDLIRTLIGHSNDVNSIEMLSEQFMSSGGEDNKVIIWDLSSYSIKYTLTGHTSPVTCVKRLSSNLIASGYYNGKIIIWNWLTGEQIFNLNGHMGPLGFNSLDLYDEQTLISGSRDQTVKLWNITNGALIRSINVDIKILSLAMLKSSEWKIFKNRIIKIKCLKIFSLSLSLLASPIYASFLQTTTTSTRTSTMLTSKFFSSSQYTLTLKLKSPHSYLCNK